jgi:hypothetical protein
VPAAYNPDTRQLTYRPISVLRQPEIGVQVRLRRLGQEKDDVVSWKFFVEQKAYYAPTGTASLDAVEGTVPVAAPSTTGEQ